ncbi:MAG: thymidine kinase [Proteobacteria bacterium]|nr:thymidine kinase [Pseudomonadota bacterium]
MAKLYFRYGTVGSAKTLNLLAVAHNYQQQNKKVFLIKPKLDIRFGEDDVRSRAGLNRKADLLVDSDSIINYGILDQVNCVVVDEVQFLSKALIDQFRYIATVMRIPVICYGLRTDFRGELFDGSKRLFEIADTIEEVKTTCNFCDKKAIFNLKIVDGQPCLTGPIVELGAEEKYLPTCAGCYRNKLEGQYF